MGFRLARLLALCVVAAGFSSTTCSSTEDTGAPGGGSLPPPVVSPEELGFPAPDPLPDLPAGVDAFVPPGADGNPDTIIAEGVNIGDPGDTLVVTGDGFVPGSTVFDIFSQHPSASSGETLEVQAGHLDEYAASIPLPDTLPPSTMYLIYPRTGSRGLPFAVNHATARWVGPDLVAPGDTAAVYGTNLAYGHGTETSHVYLKPIGVEPGQYLTVAEVNPYRVDFVVPGDITPGEHEVWLHNGHGGHYGWSGPLLLEVVGTSPFAGYDSSTFDVTDYGAVGDGQTDDYDALDETLQAASDAGPATVYLPAGTYRISTTLRIPAHVKVMGDGVGSTIIESTPDFEASNDWLVWIGQCDEGRLGSEVTELTLDSTPGDNYEVLRFRHCEDTRLTNVHLIGDVDLHEMYRLHVTNVQIDGHVFYGTASQVFLDHVTQRVGEHRDVMTIWGGHDFSISHHVAQDLDQGQTGGISSGRFLVIQGHWGRVHDVYIGDTETIELSCALDKPDQNSGEQILFELPATFYQDTATPATASTVTLTGWGRDDFEPDSSNDLIVVQGKGLGQRRAITDWDPNTMTATVEPPFIVVPDETTRIQIARAVTDFIVYRSTIQGKPDFADRHTASSGVQPYGHGYGVVADGNHFHQLRAPWSLWAMNTSSPEAPVAPSYFNLFINNTVDGTVTGALLIAKESDGGSESPLGLLGNVVRNNEFADVRETGIRLAGDGTAAYTVIDANTFTDTFTGVRATRESDAPPGEFRANLLLRNAFERGAAPYEDSVGFESDAEIIWELIGNSFDGYESGEP